MIRKNFGQFYPNYSTIDNIFVDSLFEMNLNSMKQSLRKYIVFISLFGFLSIVIVNCYLKYDFGTKFLNSNFYNKNETSIIDNEKSKYS